MHPKTLWQKGPFFTCCRKKRYAKLIFNDRESRPHKVEVNMEAGQEEKQFTILGFGYVP